MRKFMQYAVVALSLAAAAGQAQEHRRGQAAQASGAPVKKWETDASVRRGMDAIRQAMAAKRQDIEQDRLDSAEYRKLADVVERQVKEMVTAPGVSPALRNALNTVVFTDIANSAELMRSSPKRPAQRIAALGILRALASYGEYFDHPGWPADAGVTR